MDPTPLPCAECAQPFIPKRAVQRFCSIACSSGRAKPWQRGKPSASIRAAQAKRTELARSVPKLCPHCAQPFVSGHGNPAYRRYCSRECATVCRRECQATHRLQLGRQADPRQASKNQRRRAARRGLSVERFTERDIFERDGWRCQLCRATVDPVLVWPHPLSASLDHILPISKGGQHRRANVQLAHLRCNVEKSDRAAGRLRLFG